MKVAVLRGLLWPESVVSYVCLWTGVHYVYVVAMFSQVPDVYLRKTTGVDIATTEATVYFRGLLTHIFRELTLLIS